MNVLAIDSSLGAVSAAVRWRAPSGEWLLREAYETRSAGHAERLMQMIAEVLDGAGLTFSDLDRIAVTVGPGGFTGVRVGISAARALALATGKPVVAATSLAVMAHRAEALMGALGGKSRLVVAVEARRGAQAALYVQSFAAGASATGEALMLTPHEAAHWACQESALIVGPAAPALAALVREVGGDAEAQLPELQPHAASLAMMAASLAPVSSVTPLYLRPPDVRAQDGASLARVRS